MTYTATNDQPFEYSVITTADKILELLDLYYGDVSEELADKIRDICNNERGI